MLVRLLNEGLWIHVLAAGLAVIGSNRPASAQCDIRLVNGLAGAPQFAVEDNTVVYSNQGIGAVVLDATNPATPTKLTQMPPGIRSVALSGGVLFASGQDGLYTYDMSDPAAPQVLGMLARPSPTDVIRANDGVVYLGESNRLVVVEVLDPLAPRLIGELTTGKNVRDVVIGSGRIYVLQDDLIEAYELTGALPSLIGTLTVPGRARHATVLGDLLLVTKSNDDLEIFDWSVPSAPVALGSIDLGEVGVIAARGDLAYVATPEDLVTIDVSSPSTPVITDRLPLIDTSIPGDAKIVDDTLFVWDIRLGLLTFDISQQAARLGGFRTISSVYRVAVRDGIAYVANDSKQLSAIDVSDPESPALAGWAELGGIARQVVIDREAVYVTNNSLASFNIPDPLAPLPPSTQSPGFFPVQSLDVSESFVYAVTERHLRVYRTTFRGGFTFWGEFPLPAYEIDVVGNLLYTVDRGTLRIIDASDPGAPVALSEYQMTATATGIQVVGEYAFISRRDGELHVVNVANPEMPEFAGSYLFHNTLNDVHVSGDLLVASGGISGVVLFDVSDPESPKLLGSSAEAGSVSNGIFIEGTRVYTSGIFRIFDVSTCVPCYADCDGDRTLGIFDFLCFQDAFVQMDPYADCDGNTAFDIFDFLCFQDAFVTGCP